MAVLESAEPGLKYAQAVSFGPVDLVWEQAEEAAVRGYRAGGVDAALLYWRRGLAIARAKFEPGDPRLGTSLINHAFALRRLGETFLARRHFDEARQAFDEDWRWIGRMRPAGRSERGYDQAVLSSFNALARELHVRAQTIEAWDVVPGGRWERWRQERPAGGSDLRKLLAASLLLVSLPG